MTMQPMNMKHAGGPKPQVNLAASSERIVEGTRAVNAYVAFGTNIVPEILTLPRRWAECCTILRDALDLEAKVLDDAGRQLAASMGVLTSVVVGMSPEVAQEKVNSLWDDAVARIHAKYAEEANAIGERARNAFAELQKTIVAAIQRAKSPLWSAEARDSLEELFSLDRLSQEIEAQAPIEFEKEYLSALDVGDVKRARMLERAGWPVMDRFVTASYARNVGKSSAQRSAERVDAEGRARLAAIRVMAKMDEQRTSRVDPALIATEKTFKESMFPLFQRLLGISVWQMSSSEFQAKYGADASEPMDSFETDPSWVVRSFTTKTAASRRPAGTQTFVNGQALKIGG